MGEIMSLRYEQYYALLRTREFLRKILIMPKKDLITWPIGEFRSEVYACLKHFPFLDEQGQPYWSQDEFTKDRANIENDMGKGFYFSSSYDDVVMNYDDVYGADLSNRIERLAEQLEYSKDISYEDAKKLAQKRLVGGVNKVLEVYISLQNPAIIGGNNETYIDYNWDEEEGESGLFVDFYNELQYVASQYYDVDLSNWISNGFWEGGGLSDFIKAVKGSEGLAYATDEKGNLAASEIIRETLENMGFDGIIDNTVSSKFKNMQGLYNDTQHVIAFESNQIKSTDNKTWCKDNVKINLSSWKNK